VLLYGLLQVRWWLRGENIYVAHNIDVGKAIRYVLSDLKQQVMYEVRVFGYSRGGDGLQSSPTLEFVLGETQNSSLLLVSSIISSLWLCVVYLSVIIYTFL